MDKHRNHLDYQNKDNSKKKRISNIKEKKSAYEYTLKILPIYYFRSK